jgi:hypothetical protein
MATTPEGKVKAKVKKLFAQFGTELYYFMPVQCGYGSVGLDFHCCYRGVAFAVETKAGKGQNHSAGKITARQKATIAAMQRASMTVFVVDGTPTTLSDLELFLCGLQQQKNP